MTRSHAPAAMQQDQEIWSGIEPIGAPESVGALLARNVTRFGNHAAFMEKRDGRYHPVSWRELALQAAALGRYLKHAGIGAGDRVLFFRPTVARCSSPSLP